MDTLKISCIKEAVPWVVIFEGQINEDADFSDLSNVSGSSIIFDLDKINHINSCGIREWIKFQQTLPEKTKIIYRKCPQVLVEQMNIVKGFIKEGGIIESFYAPYFCETLDEEIKMLLTPNQIQGGKAPVLTHPKTADSMEFDDIELQYFSFLK